MPLSRRFAPTVLSLLLCLASSGALHAHGDLSARIAEVKAASAQHPEDGGLQLELATLQFQDGLFSEAVSVLNALDRRAPGQFFTDKLRGSALLALLKPAPAREALDRFLTRFPGDPSALVLRARSFQMLSLTKESLADYREALARTAAPEPDLLQETAAALTSAGCREEALSVLEKGLKHSGPIPSLMQRALELELALKRYDAALSRVEALRRAGPRPEPWMAQKAAILTQAGRITESRAAWQGLLSRLATLPAAERGSHAMSRFAEEARRGLTALHGLASLEILPASPNSCPDKSSSLTKP